MPILTFSGEGLSLIVLALLFGVWAGWKARGVLIMRNSVHTNEVQTTKEVP